MPSPAEGKEPGLAGLDRSGMVPVRGTQIHGFSPEFILKNNSVSMHALLHGKSQNPAFFCFEGRKRRDQAETPIKTGKERAGFDGTAGNSGKEEKTERAGSCRNRRPGVGVGTESDRK